MLCTTCPTHPCTWTVNKLCKLGEIWFIARLTAENLIINGTCRNGTPVPCQNGRERSGSPLPAPVSVLSGCFQCERLCSAPGISTFCLQWWLMINCISWLEMALTWSREAFFSILIQIGNFSLRLRSKSARIIITTIYLHGLTVVVKVTGKTGRSTCAAHNANKARVASNLSIVALYYLMSPTRVVLVEEIQDVVSKEQP